MLGTYLTCGASASYGALLYCGSALVVGVIMHFKLDYTKALAVTEMCLGLVAISIVRCNLREKYQ